MKSVILSISVAFVVVLCCYRGGHLTVLGSESIHPPKPCCLPDTWQGFVKIIFGVAEGYRRARGGMVKTEMFVDGRKMRVAGKVNTGYPGSDFTFVGFFNQATGKGFRFFSYKTFNASKCWTYYWDKFVYYKPCLPEKSIFKESIHIGRKESGQVAHAWTINETRSGFKFIAEILVSEDCIPIVLRDLGSAGIMKEATDVDDDSIQEEISSKTKQKPHPFKKFVIGALYSDVELQIKDYKVFELPEVCKKNLLRYPPKSEDLSDKETRQGFEYLQTVVGHMMV